MLEVSNLSVGYGPVLALDQVSLSVPDGSITAVLGANGAGKTTLVRTISGLVHRRSGSIRLAGAEISSLAPEAVACLGVSHVPEGQGVITELTVEENLRLGALAHGGGNSKRDLEEAYQLFPPLAARRALPAGTLSGGERQMLALARGLAAHPRLLLLDEPSLGLAGQVLAQIMAKLRALVNEGALTVLLIEQNARSALSVADRAIVLSLGRVVQGDPTSELRSDAELLGAYLGF
ncbi:MAG: ABC transporter ATP-binding protein [Candidatus Dormibacteria bacterium]